MSFLGVIVDCNSRNWSKLLAKSEGAETFQMVISSVLALCSTHILSSIDNQILVMGAGMQGVSGKLFSSAQSGVESAIQEIEQKLRSAITAPTSSGSVKEEGSEAPKSVYVSSLSTCLCSHQRFKRDYGDEAVGRIVVINFEKNLSAEQNVLMNLFFVAQQQSVKIDVVSLDVAVPILQQACDITSGSHSLVQNPMQLVQFLMSRGLANSHDAENAFEPEFEEIVDYRAACHCHNQLVEFGFVCSVCLAVHCKYVPLCVACNTFFRPPTVARKKRKE